jgi:hypothetical protein
MTSIKALTNKFWEQKKSDLFFQHFPTQANLHYGREAPITLLLKNFDLTPKNRVIAHCAVMLFFGG